MKKRRPAVAVRACPDSRRAVWLVFMQRLGSVQPRFRTGGMSVQN